MVSAALLFLILRRIDWSLAWQALSSIRLPYLGLAWVLFLLGVVVRAARWGSLLTALGVRRPLTELSYWYFVGSFFNVVLPTGFGGDAVRVAELGQDTNRAGAVLNTVLMDRFSGIMVLLAMGLAAALAAPGLAPPSVVALTAAVFAGGLLLVALLRSGRWARWQERAGSRPARLSWLRLPALQAELFPYGRRTVLRVLLASLLFNLLQVAWNMSIARGLGLSLPLSTFLVLVPLTALALLLPAFGGLGVREISYVGLFATAGVAEPTALALSVGVYIITVATGLVGGGLYLAHGLGRTWGRGQRT